MKKDKEVRPMINVWKFCCTDYNDASKAKWHIKYTKGYVVPFNYMVRKSLIDDILNAIDGFDVRMITYSTKWRNWAAILDLKTCMSCRKLHGKIYGSDERIDPGPKQRISFGEKLFRHQNMFRCRYPTPQHKNSIPVPDGRA